MRNLEDKGKKAEDPRELDIVIQKVFPLLYKHDADHFEISYEIGISPTVVLEAIQYIIDFQHERLYRIVHENAELVSDPFSLMQVILLIKEGEMLLKQDNESKLNTAKELISQIKSSHAEYLSRIEALIATIISNATPKHNSKKIIDKLIEATSLRKHGSQYK